jgi:hypothetical protein
LLLDTKFDVRAVVGVDRGFTDHRWAGIAEISDDLAALIRRVQE